MSCNSLIINPTCKACRREVDLLLTWSVGKKEWVWSQMIPNARAAELAGVVCICELKLIKNMWIIYLGEHEYHSFIVSDIDQSTGHRTTLFDVFNAKKINQAWIIYVFVVYRICVEVVWHFHFDGTCFCSSGVYTLVNPASADQSHHHLVQTQAFP